MAFREQVVMANLRHLTYRCSGFKGAMLEPAALENGCPLDNGRHDDTPKASTAALGTLDVLPVELVQMILLDLDLQSLTLLRCVNHRTRLAIDALWQYSELMACAPNSVRAALSINLGNAITCRQLHAELCSQQCVNCGRFGAFLYLLTCSRVCYVCLVEDSRFLPMTPNQARTTFGLSSYETSKLPTAISLPGMNSQTSKIRRARIPLVDRTHSRLAGVTFHKSVEHVEKCISQRQAKKKSSYEARMQKNRVSGSRSPPRPACTEAFDGQGGNPYRFMCVVRFPWLDSSNGKIEWGLNCTGCRDKFHDRTHGKLDWRWLYTSRGYVEHVGHCEKSMAILKSRA